MQYVVYVCVCLHVNVMCAVCVCDVCARTYVLRTSGR